MNNEDFGRFQIRDSSEADTPPQRNTHLERFTVNDIITRQHVIDNHFSSLILKLPNIIKESTIEHLKENIINIIKEEQNNLNMELSTQFPEDSPLIDCSINQNSRNQNSINQKYLKYKQKYLQLKKNLNN